MMQGCRWGGRVSRFLGFFYASDFHFVLKASFGSLSLFVSFCGFVSVYFPPWFVLLV